MDELKIKQSEIDENNVKSAPDDVNDDPQTIKHIFDKLPELIAAKFNSLVEYIKVTFYTKNQVDEVVAQKIIDIGAADMQKSVYDTNNNGVVDKAETALFAENGFSIYTHTAGTLEGSGTNGKFKATASETVAALNVNGTVCSVKCGEDNEMELIEGCWYTFILDGNTINFKQGGAGLDFKIVGGTTQPVSPKPNTIWVNTSTAIGEYQFSATQPTTRADGTALQSGDVWLKTSSAGLIEFNVLKKNKIMVKILGVYQYNNSTWGLKNSMVYKDSKWCNVVNFWYKQGVFAKDYTYGSINGGSVTLNIGDITIKCSGSTGHNTRALCFYAELTDIDLISANFTSYTGDGLSGICICKSQSDLATKTFWDGTNAAIRAVTAPKGVKSANVSSLTGYWYVYVGVTTYTGYSATYTLSEITFS